VPSLIHRPLAWTRTLCSCGCLELIFLHVGGVLRHASPWHLHSLAVLVVAGFLLSVLVVHDDLAVEIETVFLRLKFDLASALLLILLSLVILTEIFDLLLCGYSFLHLQLVLILVFLGCLVFVFFLRLLLAVHLLLFEEFDVFFGELADQFSLFPISHGGDARTATLSSR